MEKERGQPREPKDNVALWLELLNNGFSKDRNHSSNTAHGLSSHSKNKTVMKSIA